MPDFSIALSGLQANSTALNTIGNNLANLNTTAYKGQSTTFEDLFYQQVGESGSGNPIQVGVGTRVSGTTSNFTQGSNAPTQKTTDMALAGNGFFVVQQGGVQSLTRAGNFQLDTFGNLTTIDGQNVMGYPAVNNVAGVSSQLSPLTLPLGQVGPAAATANIGVTVNLDSTASVGSAFSTPVTVYDSLGASHLATVSYTKTSGTTWDYAVTLPSADATAAPTGNKGTLTFSSTGALVTPAGNVSGSGGTFTGLTDGASTINLTLNLYNAAGTATIAQSASANATNGVNSDGNASGTYQGFTVDPNGVITASFSGGGNHTKVVGQVAVASIANLDGLSRVGGNNYQTTSASGIAAIGAAGVGGRAKITDSALEASNVDISSEFANLIVAQRAFEANSKTVTTFDTISQAVISMIR